MNTSNRSSKRREGRDQKRRSDSTVIRKHKKDSKDKGPQRKKYTQEVLLSAIEDVQV